MLDPDNPLIRSRLVGDVELACVGQRLSGAGVETTVTKTWSASQLRSIACNSDRPATMRQMDYIQWLERELMPAGAPTLFSDQIGHASKRDRAAAAGIQMRRHCGKCLCVIRPAVALRTEHFGGH